MKVGDKVRCIDTWSDPPPQLKVGQIYTITAYYDDNPNSSDIFVDNIKPSWDKRRFELVNDEIKIGDMLECVDDNSCGLITTGKLYQVLAFRGNVSVTILDNYGRQANFTKDRFKKVANIPPYPAPKVANEYKDGFCPGAFVRCCEETITMRENKILGNRIYEIAEAATHTIKLKRHNGSWDKAKFKLVDQALDDRQQYTKEQLQRFVVSMIHLSMVCLVITIAPKWANNFHYLPRNEDQSMRFALLELD